MLRGSTVISWSNFRFETTNPFPPRVFVAVPFYPFCNRDRQTTEVMNRKKTQKGELMQLTAFGVSRKMKYLRGQLDYDEMESVRAGSSKLLQLKIDNGNEFICTHSRSDQCDPATKL